MRRGNEADFDASKMLPGEWAVSLDTKYVRMCFAPGLVLRMANYESFEADMAQIQEILSECRTIQSVVQRIQSEVNSKASLVVEYSDSAKKSADRAYSEAERAKTYANNAEAVTGVNIATQDRAGLVKGGDNYIAEDGTLTLIKQTSETTMPNSYSGRFKVDEIGGGESEQFTTTGKNLLQNTSSSTSANGVTFTVNADGSVTANGTATATSNFTIFVTIPVLTGRYFNVIQLGGSYTGDMYHVAYDANWAGGKDSSINTASVMNDTINYSRFRLTVKEGAVCKNLRVGFIVATSGYDTWEPYTGGIPSPNPSYPQEIKKTVVSEIRTHGKNFWKHGDISKGTEAGIPWKLPKGTYTFSCVASTIDLTLRVYFADGTSKVIAIAQTPTTFTLENDVFSFNYNSIKEDTITNIQVEAGTVATAYEPYTESVVTLSQPIDLYHKGDVQDVIEGGKVKRRFEEVVFDGSDDEGWTKSTNIENRYYIDGYMNNPKNHGLCTHGINGAVYTTTLGEFYIVNSTRRFAINTSIPTLEEWKANLVNNPMTMVYELAEEVIEDLPIADQIALNSLKTFNGITYLEFDSEIEPTFKGEYGTSKVGGYTLEGMLASRNGELLAQSNANRITALEATVVNNI